MTFIRYLFIMYKRGDKMKLLLMLKSILQIKETSEVIDGYIIGITGLSTNMPAYFSLDELKEILKITNKEVFVSLNKNMHSSDLINLKETLKELEKLNIEGILYYDVSIVNIKQELSLKKSLVWNAEHLVTNSLSINFWCEEGISYAFLSSDITKDEIIKIKERVNIPLMMNIFGYIPIFTSYRHLVKNYLKTFALKDNSIINYILKENKKYPVVDYENTTVYSNNILNASLDLNDINIEYGVINSFNIDDEIIIEIIKLFKKLNSSNKEEITKKINSYFNNIDDGFLNKETIYKVIK